MSETDVSDRELLRLLHGELPAERARQVAERLERDPELAARYRRLAAAWEALEAPPASPPPPGFAGRVMARVRERAAAKTAVGWSAAPLRVRAAYAAALAAGVLLGVGLGLGWRPPEPAAVVAVQPSVAQPGPGAAPTVRSAAPAAPAEAVPAAPAPPGTAAAVGSEEPDAELPADLSPDAALTAGYWVAIGLADELEDAAAADEEPWS